MLLEALPDPKRARKEAFLLKKESSILENKCFSKSINESDKAAIADAEEAIPLL